jgi:hypothetical protein
MKYDKIREEELKNKVGADFFADFDTTAIVGNIDFCVSPPSPSGRAGEGLVFSDKALAVFDAGRQLWQYYHHTINANKVVPPSGVRGLVNASLYDIREHFQGRNPAGKMNNKSQDETYSQLINNLRQQLKILAKKIEPKVYQYGFLKE